MANIDELYPQYTAEELDRILEAVGLDRQIIEIYHQTTEFQSTDAYNIFRTVVFYVQTTGICLGMLFNIFIIALLLSMKRKLKSSLQLILSLAVSDALISASFFCIFLVPVVTLSVVADKIVTSVYAISELAGHTFLVALATDILIAVRKPLQYRSLMSIRRGNVLNTCVWTICSLLVISIVLVIELVSLGDIVYEITLYQKYFSFAAELFNVVFVLILAINIAIVIEVKRSMLKSMSVAKQLKMAFMLATVILCYVVFQLPFLSTYGLISDPANDGVDVFTYIVYGSTALRTFRSVVNPLIYAVRSPEVYNHAKRMLGMKKRRVHRKSVVTKTISTTSTTIVK